MAKHALVPDQVIMSPAKRAQESWKYAAAGFSSPPATITQEWLYNAQSHTIFAALKEIPDSIHHLLIVGHNPALHELALMLIASGDIDARERLQEGLPAASLVLIGFAFDNWRKLHAQSGRLERFITPRTLVPPRFEE